MSRLRAQRAFTDERVLVLVGHRKGAREESFGISGAVIHRQSLLWQGQHEHPSHRNER